MSDQDFFFDEDEAAEEAAPAKTERKQTSAKKPTRSAAAAPAVQSVSVTVAALIGVVALLAGIIVGILIPSGSTAPAAKGMTGRDRDLI